jgi:solute carrier family 13 (sodium-dependent dicarboxylate transporter), member 2/3/5
MDPPHLTHGLAAVATSTRRRYDGATGDHQMGEEDEAIGVPGAAFERTKRRVGLVAGPVLAVLFALIFDDSASPALVGLLVLCVTWWLFEALPVAVVALAAVMGAVLTGIATPEVAFKPFGSPLLYMFVGSFFIAEAMQVHGLGARIAEAVARRAQNRLSFLVAISLVAFTQSMFMSNAATTALLLPLVLGMAPRGDRYGAALVLAVAWGASAGGLGTPVGTVPNGLGLAELRQRGFDLGFIEWMAIGVPMGLVMLAGLLVVLALLFGVRRGQPLPVRPAVETRPWSQGERAVLVAFALAIAGWLAPTVANLVAPGSAAARWIGAHLTEEVVALFAGCLLFVMPGGKDRPALTWREATRIEWAVVILFGGGVMLGTLTKSTGLAAQWGQALVGATGASTTWSITALVTGTAIVLSEMTSNTATASMMAPLSGALAAAAGAAPIPAVLGATLGASFGFVMPISSGPNALAYATGRVTVGQMFRTGIVFDVIGFVLIVATLRIMCPLLGWC